MRSTPSLGITAVGLLPLFLLSAASSPGTVFTVSNAGDSGAGSFRQALLDANASAGPNQIHFSIPGSGVHTLAPLTPWPEITNSVVIDGYTQPASKTNSLADGSDAVLLVRLDGVNLTNGLPYALIVKASACTIRGLVIVRFPSGIEIYAGGGNRITGNWIGLDTDNIARGMTFDGITVTCPVFATAMGNTIGGNAPGDRNVISGNRVGVFFTPTTAAYNLVTGNYIGTDAQGLLPRGNLFAGVSVQSATNISVVRNLISASSGAGGAGIKIVGGSGDVLQLNTIGTDRAAVHDLGNAGDGILVQGATGVTIGSTNAGVGAGNYINCNHGYGINLLGSSANVVEDNVIGSNGSGAWPLGNWTGGIYVSGSSNRIGGLGTWSRNEIVYNGAAGVQVDFGTANQISGNGFYDNAGLAIDLESDGTTANDEQDGDAGANQLQNYPVLTGATLGGGSIQVDGALNSVPATKFQLEFYLSYPWDPLGLSEGEFWVGATNVTTDLNGNATVRFSAAVPEWVSADYVVTAIAIDPVGNTSEFSAAATLVQTLPNPVSLSIAASGGNTMISWPSTAAGFRLETAGSLAPPVHWTGITNGIIDNGTTRSFVISNTAAASNQFFRLNGSQ